jgi:hypothetical protein
VQKPSESFDYVRRVSLLAQAEWSGIVNFIRCILIGDRRSTDRRMFAIDDAVKL